MGSRVIVVGGGFGGLAVTQALKKADVQILLLDKTNHHLFQPLLYQVATAALSPADIAMPIREILRHQANTTVIMGEVTAIDKQKRNIRIADGESFSYDILILAVGGQDYYFGNQDWIPYAPGLKTLNDAVLIREKVLMAFEHAERCPHLHEAYRYLRFVIIGGGPTGVELAGAIAEIARETMFKNFRKIKPEQAEIYLVEGADQILPAYPLSLGKKAQKALERLGVDVLTKTKVSRVTEHGVWVGEKFIEASNVIWAAGTEGSPLLKKLDTPLDRLGRVLVENDMSVPGYPEIFVIGDSASFNGKEGNPLPGIAPVAIQQGRYVAKLISKKILPGQRKGFRYFDKGQMATIGRAKAVAMVGKLKISGFLAWLAWCFIHIIYLINFRSRIMVMMEWMFWYLTGHRNARLILSPIKEETETKKP